MVYNTGMVLTPLQRERLADLRFARRGRLSGDSNVIIADMIEGAARFARSESKDWGHQGYSAQERQALAEFADRHFARADEVRNMPQLER